MAMVRTSMGMPSRSLRLRLILLILAALVPSVLFLIHAASRQRTAAIAQVQAETLRSAQLAALHGHQVMDRLEETLESAARSAEVRSQDAEECRKRFGRELASTPNLVSLVFATPQGHVLAGAYKASSGTGVGDRSSFRRAMQGGTFAVGDPAADPRTGVTTITGSYPVYAWNGRLIGAVVGTIDPDFSRDLSAMVSVRPDADVFLLDLDGRVLARYPEPARWVGHVLTPPNLLAMLRDSAEGVKALKGADGVERYYGFTSVRGSTPHSFYALSSVPLKSAMLEARRSMYASAIGLVVALSLALVLAWAGFEALIIRRVRDLVDTTRRLQDGDLSARTLLPYGDDELSQLARSFDAMAEGLEEHVAERDRAQSELAAANSKLTAWVSELEQNKHEISLLSEMGELLRASETPQDSHSVVEQVAVELFPGSAGVLYMANDATGDLEPVASWGPPTPWTPFRREQCWALRLGHLNQFTRGHEGVACEHAPSREGSAICAPITVKGTVLGLFHVQVGSADRRTESSAQVESAWRRQCEAVAGKLALAYSNLRLQESLRAQAFRDDLTGLYNRRYFEEALQREVSRTERRPAPLSLLMIDLDGFKQLNDNQGHRAGDEVLRTVGLLLAERVRDEDIACRYGGDEFVVVMANASRRDVTRRAEQIRRAIAEAARRTSTAGVVTATIGVALYPGNGATVDELIRSADHALYRGKNAGGNCVIVAPEEAFALTGS